MSTIKALQYYHINCYLDKICKLLSSIPLIIHKYVSSSGLFFSSKLSKNKIKIFFLCKKIKIYFYKNSKAFSMRFNKKKR